jgi:hypothetical protein
MNQTFALSKKTLASKCDRQILCFYINSTSRIQIIRITNIPNLHLERMVFPGQRLMFEAVPEAKLEVYTHESATAILAEVISCQQLRVTDSQAED